MNYGFVLLVNAIAHIPGRGSFVAGYIRHVQDVVHVTTQAGQFTTGPTGIAQHRIVTLHLLGTHPHHVQCLGCHTGLSCWLARSIEVIVLRLLISQENGRAMQLKIHVLFRMVLNKATIPLKWRLENANEVKEFRGIVKEMLHCFAAIHPKDFFSILKWVDPMGLDARFLKQRARMDTFYTKMISRHREYRKRKAISGEDELSYHLGGNLLAVLHLLQYPQIMDSPALECNKNLCKALIPVRMKELRNVKAQSDNRTGSTSIPATAVA